MVSVVNMLGPFIGLGECAEISEVGMAWGHGFPKILEGEESGVEPL